MPVDVAVGMWVQLLEATPIGRWFTHVEKEYHKPEPACLGVAAQTQLSGSPKWDFLVS